MMYKSPAFFFKFYELISLKKTFMTDPFTSAIRFIERKKILMKVED